jgi:CRP-like cAMP-binding protein
MRLIMKNPSIVRTAEEHGINLANLAMDMVLVTYKKGDLIVDYGDMNHNFYILKKGTLKLTECEPGSSSFGQPSLNRRVLNVHYVSEEGHSFFGNILDISDGVQ